jgi:ABC transporter fused permease/ATP-binding protein
MARSKKQEGDAPKVKITRENIGTAWKLVKYLKPYRFKFFTGLLFLLLTSLTALAFPLLVGKLVDSASQPTPEGIDKVGILLLILFSTQAVFSYFRIMLFVNVTENVLSDLRKTLFSKLLRLPMAFYSSRRVGELNSRLSTDINQIQDTFTTTIAEFLRQIIIIIGGIGMLMLTSGRLTLVMLAIVPLLVTVAVFFGRFIRKYSREVQDLLGEANTIIEETLQGIATVKSFANEMFEVNRYSKTVVKVKNKAIMGGKYRGAFASFIIFCLFGAIVLVMWYGLHLVEKGEISVGSMFSFILYSVFVGASIGGVAELYAQLQKTIGATERIFEILNQRTEMDEPGPVEFLNKYHDHNSGSNISFETVSFSYPSRREIKVLNKVTFKIEPGQRVALVGPSGAGKSTVIALMLRFYEPDSGIIHIDGVPANDIPLHTLRNKIALVPQEVLLFGGTIRENIAYGKPDASEDEIILAARKANAFDFIDGFPEKFDTTVGDRGVKLSGGQRQRIAIARAILKNPSFLLLDEATSSLDSESERLVQEALEELMQNRTSLIIAHRLSTIRNADKILVLDQGNIAESGTHDELVSIENGIYKNLSTLQFKFNE